MKCILILALATLSQASPLVGWGGIGGYGIHGEFLSPYQYQHHHGEDADHVANKVTQEAVHDQLAHTHEAIKGLEEQLEHHPHSFMGSHFGGVYDPEVVHHLEKVGPSVASKAIHHLEEDFEHQKHHLTDPEKGTTQHLHDTVEAGVEAQLTADDVSYQSGGHVPIVSGLHAGVFQSRLKKLIDEHNEQEIEKQISHHHHWAQQLHHQQQFVQQQKQQIEAQQSVLHHQGTHDHNLEQAHHHLQMQEFYLIHEQLAHHLAILQLQEAIVHKEKQVLEDTIAEHVHEKAAHDHEFMVSHGAHHYGLGHDYGVNAGGYGVGHYGYKGDHHHYYHGEGDDEHHHHDGYHHGFDHGDYYKSPLVIAY